MKFPSKIFLSHTLYLKLTRNVFLGFEKDHVFYKIQIN
jgi:hypothetical protein